MTPCTNMCFTPTYEYIFEIEFVKQRSDVTSTIIYISNTIENGKCSRIFETEVQVRVSARRCLAGGYNRVVAWLRNAKRKAPPGKLNRRARVTLANRFHFSSLLLRIFLFSSFPATVLPSLFRSLSPAFFLFFFRGRLKWKKRRRRGKSNLYGLLNVSSRLHSMQTPGVSIISGK